MEFQFSFGTKHELIDVNGQTYINQIGALLQCVIDTDWTTQQKQVKEWESNGIPKSCYNTQFHKVIEALDCHPVITLYLEQAASDGTIDEAINTLAKAKDILLIMLEIIVDENKSNYNVRLYELVYERAKEQLQSPNIRRIDGQYGIQIGDVQAAVLAESSQKLHFATEDLTSLLCMELQQICMEQYYIRKCAHCRKFFWTRITTKIYCNRTAPGRTTPCNQYGPQRKRYIGKHPASNLYWKYRAKAFQRMAREKNSHAFQDWVKATQPYKEAARRGEITAEAMKELLEKIEMQVFPARFELTNEPEYLKK